MSTAAGVGGIGYHLKQVGTLLTMYDQKALPMLVPTMLALPSNDLLVAFLITFTGLDL